MRRAAGYGWRILTNRPFAEGNKRMALAAMVTFLGDERLHVELWRGGRDGHVQRAAAEEMKEDEWQAWVIRNVGKKE